MHLFMMQSDLPYITGQLLNKHPFNYIIQHLSSPQRRVLFGDNLKGLSRLGFKGNEKYKQIEVLLYRRSRGHSRSVTSVAFSPDGKQVVSGSNDETVRLWNAATEAPLQTLEGHSDWVTSVALSLDGKLLPTLHVINHWLAEGNTDFLWLLTDFRPTCQAVWDRVVVLGHSLGPYSSRSHTRRSVEC